MNRFNAFLMILILNIFFAASLAIASSQKILIKSDDIQSDLLIPITKSIESVLKSADENDTIEIDRYHRRVIDSVVSLLSADGYFSPHVEVNVEYGLHEQKIWNVFIIAGRRTTVAKLDISFAGSITDKEFDERVQFLIKNCLLQNGMGFTNREWNNTKSKLLNALLSHDFFFAKIVKSEATIDQENALAYLSIVIDSGPRILMGALNVSGLNKVPESLLKRYIRYNEGDAFDQDKLNDWQQHLYSTTFFHGVFVTIDPAITDNFIKRMTKENISSLPSSSDNHKYILPVNIVVAEAPSKKIASSIGIDDNAGIKIEGLYNKNVPFSLPIIFSTGIGVDRVRQKIFADVNLPHDVYGKQNSIGASLDNSDLHGLNITRFAIGFARSSNGYSSAAQNINITGARYEANYGALLAYDHIKIREYSDFILPSATGTVEIVRRDLNNNVDPHDGNLLIIGLGAGISLDNISPYARTRIKFQKWLPVRSKDVFTFRSELGKVWSSENLKIPDDFGFRAGGANSIRGYNYQSIGVHRGSAVVGASSVVIFSFEYNHYIDDRLGVSAFVDVGDAFNLFKDISFAIGYGIGLRIKTPAGPLSFDIAYGQKYENLRLHLSLGIAF
ncbi:outer membrane protein [Candidatus Kinetoplastibacterium blastocrithidii TCC012E]|uniref:Outer membrane protein n=1 Tax=Candidatus Kinetoplastidibacterium blastocrithidiae TCC012E TaxID=1208922 RepID=M1MCL0_9PROT|nr:BamA/TamA family outer membrane protein [Candidatus Kinetoplastibacterium blastocrithidii]AFZ83439.1 surface antigen family protein [Candidatus Kinetoplastibacterium blastocrithidii (ex Strigomonas culicis)]AGF49535.1 outer membrane protein [Candidatus Kinetoplastibacterium blastocrithidii TCC012E]